METLNISSYTPSLQRALSNAQPLPADFQINQISQGNILSKAIVLPQQSVSDTDPKSNSVILYIVVGLFTAGIAWFLYQKFLKPKQEEQPQNVNSGNHNNAPQITSFDTNIKDDNSNNFYTQETTVST